MSLIDIGRVNEYLFAAKALQHDLIIAFPCSEKLPYDFIVDNGSSSLKVQVKSTHSKAKDRDAYKVSVSKGGQGNKKAYTADDVDFIIAYVSELATFYVIPIQHIKVQTINLYPHKPNEGLFEIYKEAWHLLKTARK